MTEEEEKMYNDDPSDYRYDWQYWNNRLVGSDLFFPGD